MEITKMVTDVRIDAKFKLIIRAFSPQVFLPVNASSEAGFL